MPSAKKIKLKEEYANLMAERPDVILTRYTGLNVVKITALRERLRSKGVVYRVVKNNILKRALDERDDLKGQDYASYLTGPVAVAFVKSDFPAVAKELKDYSKENEIFKMESGIMSSTWYNGKQVQDLAEMPSREQSLSQIASMLNAPATQTAGLINQIMA